MTKRIKPAVQAQYRQSTTDPHSSRFSPPYEYHPFFFSPFFFPGVGGGGGDLVKCFENGESPSSEEMTVSALSRVNNTLGLMEMKDHFL